MKMTPDTQIYRKKVCLLFMNNVKLQEEIGITWTRDKQQIKLIKVAPSYFLA